jgi:uncharacterized protein
MSDVHNNRELSRYEISDGSERIGFMTYHVDGDTVTTPHTEVDRSHGSRGYGQQLVKAALDDIRAQGRFVQPLCPFVQAYIDRHPEYEDLVKGS